MNEKKLGILTAIPGIIGFLVWVALSEVLDKCDNPLNSVLIGLLAVGIAASIGALYHLYIRKKYPKLVKTIANEEKDERGQLIRGKTSTYTFIFITILAAGLFIYSFLNDYKIISNMISF